MNNMTPPPCHGGDVVGASRRYGIAASDWLDLSTGINPDTYPVGVIPQHFFHHLPACQQQTLLDAARTYYGCEHVVAGAGSQQIIEMLPRMRAVCRVAVPDIGYREHQFQWQRAGHDIISYCAWQPEQLTAMIERGDVDCVVVINPSNPTAVSVPVTKLLRWQQELANRGGWLIIDEAFADAVPEHSFASYAHLPGVIVLRSLGKFFGLAGLRLGFALAESAICQRIATELGPWPVAGPAYYVGENALQDMAWQAHASTLLHNNCRWMSDALTQTFATQIICLSATPLFVSIVLASTLAAAVYQALAKQGILVRLWRMPDDHSETALLRFGLISHTDHVSRQRLLSALSALQ